MLNLATILQLETQNRKARKKAVVKQTKNNSEIFRGYFLFVFHDKIARVKEGVSK
jgi:hypothetical protein